MVGVASALVVPRAARAGRDLTGAHAILRCGSRRRERGDYSTALSGYLQVVSAPGGDAFFERIALTTGELLNTPS